MSLFLRYGRLGSVNNYNGRDWLDEHDNCPYCNSTLQKLGSFHHNIEDIGYAGEGNTLCMNCGCRNVDVDKNRVSSALKESKRDIKMYFPKNISPARNCLLQVGVCNSCGWWYAIENADQCNDGYAVSYAAILQTFDSTSPSLPLEILKSELPKNIHRIHSINPRKMQDLIADILRGAYNCDVHQLGYTRDKGIDLILLSGDSSVAVQVKRREDPNKTEGVGGIREFLGAAMLQGFDNLMYVTTARKFSKDAEDAAQDSKDLGLVERFELISIDKLQALLKQIYSTDETWRAAFSSAVNREYKINQVPNPFKLINT